MKAGTECRSSLSLCPQTQSAKGKPSRVTQMLSPGLSLQQLLPFHGDVSSPVPLCGTWCTSNYPFCQVPTHTHTHIHIYMCTHKYTYTQICIHPYICVHTHIQRRAQTHIHACIHAHTHGYTHSQLEIQEELPWVSFMTHGNCYGSFILNDGGQVLLVCDLNGTDEIRDTKENIGTVPALSSSWKGSQVLGTKMTNWRLVRRKGSSVTPGALHSKVTVPGCCSKLVFQQQTWLTDLVPKSSRWRGESQSAEENMRGRF